MPDVPPFIQFITLPNSSEQDALLGFSLPFLPDMHTSSWFVSTNEQERLQEALRLQVSLIKSFWSSEVTGWDLRFVGTDDMPGVSIGLLCRLRRPARIPQRLFQEYCYSISQRVQHMFADYGYEVEPLVDEQSLFRYLRPFDFQSIAEIRKYEEVLIAEDAFTEYEFYVTYPWQWTIQNRQRLIEAMLQRQSNCLVSVYLEPTFLSPQEQSHLNHATSMQMRDLLRRCGPNGHIVFTTYQFYALNLRQPYLMRSTVAASSLQTLRQVGNIFLDELNSPQLPDHTSGFLLNDFATLQTSGVGAVMEHPRNSNEWYLAMRSLLNLECLPWGTNLGLDLPGTARLRYLADEKVASMPFRLPVVGNRDLTGVPVRTILPAMSTKQPAPSSHLSQSPTNQTTFSTPKAGLSGPEITSEAGPSGSFNIRKPEDLIGKILGNCQVEALLGQGGFGAVFRAKQLNLNRLVAVKIVLATLSTSDFSKHHKMVLRFDREALALAKLDHPHILALYEYRSEPLPYIVMPYVAGGSLADEMKASGFRPLPPEGVAKILSQVASALDYAHHQHLTHRDIKPHNLLRHSDGRIILSDFGIVQYEDEDMTALTTHQQASPFTPTYGSPEQQLGLKVDFRSDIYSLGIVIYELLCGNRPFKQPYEHVHSPMPLMRSFGIQIQPGLEAVVNKALAKQPEQRYQSAGEMARAFQAVLLSK